MWIRGVGIIRLGDSNTSGGEVISGSSTGSAFGRAFARLNDLVDCPGKYPNGRPHGVNKIVEGSPHFLYHGIPVALDGHRSECGCALITSFWPEPKIKEEPWSHPNSQLSSAAASTTNTAKNRFDDRFVLKDSEGRPASSVTYAIERESGEFEYGETDSNGQTHLLSSVASTENTNIYLAG